MAEKSQPYTSNVLGTIRGDAANIGDIASKLGVSPLAIAAPIAREMNKTEIGDYWPWSSVYELLLKDNILNYQPGTSPVTGERIFVPITHDDIADDYAYVRDNGISNVGGWRNIPGMVHRANNVVLNDIGPGKIQVGTAITLLNDYVKSGNYDGDPLDLKKYVGHYDQLVKDMQDPAAQYDLACKLYALNAKQAQNFFIDKFGPEEAGAARWDAMAPQDQAAAITAYGSLGRDQLAAKAKQQIDANGVWKPDLKNTDGASYTLYGKNAEDLNAALQGRSSTESPDTARADLAPDGTAQTASVAPNYRGPAGSPWPGIVGGALPPWFPPPVPPGPAAPGSLFDWLQPDLLDKVGGLGRGGAFGPSQPNVGAALSAPLPQTHITQQPLPAPPSPFSVPVPAALQPLMSHFFPQGLDANNTQARPSAGTSDDAGVQPNPGGSAGAGLGRTPAQLTPQPYPAPPPSPFGVPIPPELLPLVPHFFPQGFDAATQSWPSTGILGDAGAQPSPVGSAGAGLDFTRGPMTSQQASAPPVPPIDVPIPEALKPLVPFFFP